VTENARVLAARVAMLHGDRDALGHLFAASHASLATDYSVSTPRLDALVAAAAATDGVIAARMTGAGFGGCIVALVDAASSELAEREVVERYRRATGHHARAWVSRPAGGALETFTSMAS
jgi:galactokinase